MRDHRTIRTMLDAPGLTSVMASHNPLSAKLAEEAGFEAIWGSGFELSASYALPDANLLHWGTHLELMRAISATVSIPVIADIDTGFGNAVNVHHIIPQYEAAGVEAVVIEDKTFPKDSSLRPGGRQVLVPVSEFQGKLRAAVDARSSREFVVIARTEALIAGLGKEEAIKRALAYEEAGADAVLFHSKNTSPDEIVEVVEAWPGSVPIVLVPNAYPSLTESAIAELEKVRIVIYGNLAIRAATFAMRTTFSQIRRDGGTHKLGNSIASISEIFDLQGDDRLRDVESRFLA